VTEQRPDLIRVGVLLTVPDPLRTRLARWRRLLGDPQSDVVPPHITLLEPVTVPAEALPRIEAHLQSVVGAERTFGISLRGTGSFRPVSPVVFAALAAGRAACERLQALIRTGPLAIPLRFPYHPHVTIAHGVTEPLLDAAEEMLADLQGEFGVQTVDLYRAPLAPRSAPPAEWVLQRRFPLRGQPAQGPVPTPVPRPRSRRDRSPNILATGGGG
jgi:2'-5' RNA ligase